MDSELEKTKDISKLDHIRSKLEIQKLEYEVSSYKYKLSKAYRFFEFLKQISASLGILTALTGIVALTFSFYQWKHQTEQNRMVRVEERLDKALSGLSNEITGKRLSSVSSLKIFLRPVYEEHHEKILQALILTSDLGI